MNSIVIEAFLLVSDGYSTDRVVVDPELNRQFLEYSMNLGSNASDYERNLALLNARKAGLLKGRKTSKRTSFPNEDDYRYASEIAARYLEKCKNVSLDQILCDPTYRSEFDKVAQQIRPGYTPLQYRWAALNLRKASRLRPELLTHVIKPVSISLGPIDRLRPENIPTSQGIYIFYGGGETLYVGEAGSLRRRIEKHLDHSDNKELARWFWSNGFKDVQLEVLELRASTDTKIRKAMEAELIKSRHPLFNIIRVEPLWQ